MSFSEPKQIRDTFLERSRDFAALNDKITNDRFLSHKHSISHQQQQEQPEKWPSTSHFIEQNNHSLPPHHFRTLYLVCNSCEGPHPTTYGWGFYIFFQHTKVLKQQQRAERNTQTSEHDSEKMTKRKYEDKRGLSPAFMNSEIRGKNSVCIWWCKLWNIFSLDDSSSR